MQHMTREEAREYIKSRVLDYLHSEHPDAARAAEQGRQFKCLAGTHDDKTPSMIFYKDSNKVHCHACGANYDTFDLIGIDNGLHDSKDIFKKTYEYFNIKTESGKQNATAKATKASVSPIGAAHSTAKPKTEPKPEPDYSDFFLSAQKNINKTDYHTRRGISPETAARFGLGYIAEWRHPNVSKSVPATPRLIIPTSASSYLARDTRDNLSEKEKEYSKIKVGVVHLFNADALRTAQKPIFIVEGEIDALSIIEAGGIAVGLGSAANIGKLLAILEGEKPKQPLIIVPDNDERGRKAADELSEGLKGLVIPFYRQNIAGEYKDTNEALQNDRKNFISAVNKAENIEREAYLQTSAASHLQDFVNGIADSVNTEYIATGFPQLDGILDGGLFEGLYVIGAISSLGKTSLVLQIADKIAERGQDVLYFSLEMSRSELMAKSISRLTLLESMNTGGDIRNAKTARGITTGSRYAYYSDTEKEIIQKAVEAYGAYAERIFIHEGIGDIGAAQIRNEIDKHISFTGNKPVVVIDYLQILAPYEVKATDKQNTDKAVLELKRMSRDYKIPVIAISSFNRENYSSGVSMEAFKESGAVEYSSDVLIGLQLAVVGSFDDKMKPIERRAAVNSAKSKNPRDVELVILKNRNGDIGKTIAFNYYPAFNHFEERP
ncbi:hypothetical protein AGMMS50276_29500 [Synergistales bacterium]|nr:hypothetical protein AGMMS50276_29500 [Synergistales bacterium]